MSIGKNKAKVYVDNDMGLKFEDVAGVEEAKAELLDVVEFLQTPAKFTRLGGHIPKGILLVGAPGTGNPSRGRTTVKKRPGKSTLRFAGSSTNNMKKL